MNSMVQRLAVALRSRGLPWLRAVVRALGGVALHFDPAFEGNVLELAAELAAQCLKKGLPAAKEFESEIELPVCYEAEFAPDMDEVSKKTGLAAGEVAKRHAAAEYRVRSEEHTSELQSLRQLVCCLLLEQNKIRKT